MLYKTFLWVIFFLVAGVLALGIGLFWYGNRKAAELERTTRWVFIKADGRPAFDSSAAFEEVGPFRQGLAAVRLNGLWGFIDIQGKTVIAPRFDDVGEFSEDGLAPAKNDNFSWGYIDRNGVWKVEPQFREAGTFSGGRGVVWQVVDSQFRSRGPSDEILAAGIIDAKGNILRTPDPENASDRVSILWQFDEGLAPARHHGTKLYGWLDGQGNWAIAPTYTDARQFSEGLAAVKVGDYWGYINKSTLSAVQPKFPSIPEPFSEGVALVEVQAGSGYMLPDGSRAITDNFQWAKSFSGGLAAVRHDKRWGFIDHQGAWVIPAKYREVGAYARHGTGVGGSEPAPFYAAVGIGDDLDALSWNFVDANGKLLVPEGFVAIHKSGFSEGFCAVRVRIKQE